MLAASILAASLTLPGVAPAAMPLTLIRQAQEHALTMPPARIAGAQTAQTRKDRSWDGALKGAAAGAFAGLVVGLIADHAEGGSASYGFNVVPVAMSVGAGIGALTGLIVDVINK